MKYHTSDLITFCCAALLALCPLLPGAAHAEGETKPLTIPQTGYTTPVPAVYSTPAEHQGTIEWITYDSEDYLNGNAPVQKQASVYLPYGYDPSDTETRYDMRKWNRSGPWTAARKAGTSTWIISRWAASSCR